MLFTLLMADLILPVVVIRNYKEKVLKMQSEFGRESKSIDEVSDCCTS